MASLASAVPSAAATLSPKQAMDSSQHAIKVHAASKGAAPTVILLHGLLRHGHHMEPLRRHISQSTGWPAHAIDYPSKAHSIKDLAAEVAKQIRELAGPGRNSVWVVAHSLGCIILRHVYGLPDNGGITFLGIVMLAPPNQGSCVARSMRNFPFPPVSLVFSKLYGKAGIELGCRLEEGALWPLPPQPCGVIAGTRSIDLTHPVTWFTKTFRFFDGPNDGTVAVQETRLPDMADFVELPVQHSEMMWDDKVMDLVITFLKTSRFARENSS